MQSKFWDERFREDGQPYGETPNAWLVSQGFRIPDGARALCLGEAGGRNAVWLAQQGCRVTVVDYSEVGLLRARELAESKSVSLELVHADLAGWDAPESAFDLVVSVFLHLPSVVRTRTHRNAVRALVSKGFWMGEFFSKRQLGHTSGGPRDPAMLYDEALLKADLSGEASAEILVLDEVETVLDEGLHHRGPASVIRLVVQRV